MEFDPDWTRVLVICLLVDAATPHWQRKCFDAKTWHGVQEDERRAAYNSDITYVTNSELGFDYLRDNLAQVSLLPYLRKTRPQRPTQL